MALACKSSNNASLCRSRADDEVSSASESKGTAFESMQLSHFELPSEGHEGTLNMGIHNQRNYSVDRRCMRPGRTRIRSEAIFIVAEP